MKKDTYQVIQAYEGFANRYELFVGTREQCRRYLCENVWSTSWRYAAKRCKSEASAVKFARRIISLDMRGGNPVFARVQSADAKGYEI